MHTIPKAKYLKSLIESGSGLRRPNLNPNEVEAELSRLAGIVQASDDAIVSKSIDGSILAWNKSAERLFGYSAAEVIGKPITILFPLGEEAEEQKIMAKIRRGELYVNQEARRRHKDGHLLYISVCVSPILDFEGNLIGASKIARDMTERIQSQRELLDTRNRLQATLDAIPDLLFELGLDGRYYDIHSPRSDLMAAPPTIMIGKTVFDVLPSEAATVVSEALQEANSKGYSGGKQFELTLPQGQLWFELSVSRKAAEPGIDPRFICLSRDITQRKHTELALIRTETELRKLTIDLQTEQSRLVAAQEVAKVGSWDTDLATMSVIWSVETHRIFETDPATFHPTHQGFLSIVHPADRAHVDEAFVTSLQQQTPCAVEHRLLLPENRIKFIQERWKIYFDEQGNPVRAIGTCQDISDRKLSEIKIQRLNRTQTLLSGINTTIVRVHDRQELFNEVCRLAVTVGQFQVAWIGEVDLIQKRMTRVALEGEHSKEFLDDVTPISLDSKSGAEDMTDRAIYRKEIVISNDIRNDPHAHMKRQCAKRKINSVAVLPLIMAGEAVGVFALFASETGFFDDEEIKLLREIAGDISFALDHIANEEKVSYLSLYDSLTGLPNRTLFRERLTQALEAAAREGSQLAVLISDVERFRAINDSLGRKSGDDLLRQFAERARSSITDPNSLGRIGVDHFGLFVPAVASTDMLARTVEQRRMDILGTPFMLGSTELRLSMKVGIAMFPNDGADADSLLRNAEVALRRAKQSGDRYTFYSPDMTARVSESLLLENKLRLAIDNEEFVLHYQPKVDTETRKLVSVEALIRWQSPDLGLVPPASFIGLMEETGIILEAGQWALRKAALDYRKWVDMGLKAPRVAVNISALQLHQRDFVETVRQAVLADLGPAGIDLEITESLMMQDMENSIRKLNELQKSGASIAIDDFGTGYSSLAYLTQFPIQLLKIDRSFIITMLTDANRMTLVSAIISLAHSLHLKVVAEGVDDEEQAKILGLLRCDMMQGYLFSRPVPFDAITAMLRG